MKRASACLSLSVWRRLWQTRAVDKSGTPPCAPFPPNFNVALADKRGELMRYAALAESWRGLRSFARVTVCNIEDGGREGGKGFARGNVRLCPGQVRSWVQKRCRCRGGLGGMWDTSMMSALPKHSQTEVHFCAYAGAHRMVAGALPHL